MSSKKRRKTANSLQGGVKPQSKSSKPAKTRSETQTLASAPTRAQPSLPPMLPGLEMVGLCKPGNQDGDEVEKDETRATSEVASEITTSRGVKRKSSDEHDDAGGQEEPATKKPKAPSDKFPIPDLPKELFEHICDILAWNQGAKYAKEYGYDPEKYHVTVVKQVVRNSFYRENDDIVQVAPPYRPNEQYLKVCGKMQHEDRPVRLGQYQGVLRTAFNAAGSIIRATVLDLNFDYITAFLETLKSHQVEQINRNKVTIIILLENGWSDFNTKSVSKFTDLALDKFPAADEDDESAAEKDEDSPNQATKGLKSLIKFECTPGYSYLTKEYVKKVEDFSKACPYEMRLLQPFFEKWAEENPTRVA